jgi:hypothetical protein
MGELLTGRHVGETIAVPAEMGGGECTVAEVGDLSPVVLNWLRTDA